MKRSALIIAATGLGLGTLAAGVCGAVRAERSRRKPVATLRDLYKDNAALAPSPFD